MELQSSLFKNLRFIYSNINHFGIPHNNWESQMLIEKETLPKIEENTVQNKTIEVEKLFKSLSEMPSDFYSEERVDEPPQEREEF